MTYISTIGRDVACGHLTCDRINVNLMLLLDGEAVGACLVLSVRSPTSNIDRTPSIFKVCPRGCARLSNVQGYAESKVELSHHAHANETLERESSHIETMTAQQPYQHTTLRFEHARCSQSGVLQSCLIFLVSSLELTEIYLLHQLPHPGHKLFPIAHIKCTNDLCKSPSLCQIHRH